MKKFKVRFTIWLEDGVLDIAKAKAGTEGISVSEMLARAATESLVRNRKDAEAEITRAVERVYHLLQKSDRKRGFESQVLKEMIGLAILSFFNHTPAVAESQKKAALIDGKARFQKFMDTLTANLMNAHSVVRQLPDPKITTDKPVQTESKPVVKPAVKPTQPSKPPDPRPAVSQTPEAPKTPAAQHPQKHDEPKSQDLPSKPSEPNPTPQSPPGTDQKIDDTKVEFDKLPAAKKKWSLF